MNCTNNSMVRLRTFPVVVLLTVLGVFAFARVGVGLPETSGTASRLASRIPIVNLSAKAKSSGGTVEDVFNDLFNKDVKKKKNAKLEDYITQDDCDEISASASESIAENYKGTEFEDMQVYCTVTGNQWRFIYVVPEEVAGELEDVELFDDDDDGKKYASYVAEIEDELGLEDVYISCEYYDTNANLLSQRIFNNKGKVDTKRSSSKNSKSSRYATVYEYLNQNGTGKKILTNAADYLANEIVDWTGIDCKCQVSALGNQVNYIGWLQDGKVASASTCKTVQRNFDASSNLLASEIADLEDKSGVSGIIYSYQVWDGDGNLVATATYDRTGLIS